MRVCAILNRHGGMLQRDGNLAERLATSFGRHGIDADLVLSTGSQVRRHVERALHAIAQRRLDAVVVGGGDGSINAAAGVLAGTGVPLGVLPLGTLNHFAKDLGVPIDLDQAVDVIAAQEVRAVDVGEVNGRVFVNNSSVGIYPYFVLERERQRAALGIGKWLASALALLRALRRFPRRRLVIRAHSWSEPYETPCLFVGNNEYGVDPGAFGRRDRLDAGRLCLYVARRRTALGLLSLVLRAAFGRLDQTVDFDLHALASAEIRSRASRLPVALDGEVLMLPTPLCYRVRPAALRVLAPPAAAD